MSSNMLYCPRSNPSQRLFSPSSELLYFPPLPALPFLLRRYISTIAATPLEAPGWREGRQGLHRCTRTMLALFLYVLVARPREGHSHADPPPYVLAHPYVHGSGRSTFNDASVVMCKQAAGRHRHGLCANVLLFVDSGALLPFPSPFHCARLVGLCRWFSVAFVD